MESETMITAYPLQWPAGWPRTPPLYRSSGRFGTQQAGRSGLITTHEATKRVRDQFNLFTRVGHPLRVPPESVIISTMIQTRRDGFPRSGQRDPDDPGVAVYFELDGRQRAIPCDRYSSVAQNIAAIAATLEALRALERHGTGIMERAFTGFDALPSPDHVAGIHWSAILDVAPDAPPQQILRAYQRARSAAHPDKPGGSVERFHAVERAWNEYRAQIPPDATAASG